LSFLKEINNDNYYQDAKINIIVENFKRKFRNFSGGKNVTQHLTDRMPDGGHWDGRDML